MFIASPSYHLADRLLTPHPEEALVPEAGCTLTRLRPFGAIRRSAIGFGAEQAHHLRCHQSARPGRGAIF